MNFRIQPEEDKLLDEMFKGSMKELNDFYGIDWVHHVPNIFVVPDRKTIDLLWNKKTKDWIVGWVNSRDVYILDRNKMETESSHKYTPETYRALLQHELSHAFSLIVSGGTNKPKWLWEGVAEFTAGQNRFNKRPTEFKKFLEFYEHEGFDQYAEAGFAIEDLVKKFGKAKLLEVIKKLKDTDSKEKFDLLFENIYGSKPTYEFFNNPL